MTSLKSLAHRALNTGLAASAIALIALVVHKEVRQDVPSRKVDVTAVRHVDRWETLFDGGERLGPEGAPVGMVVFSDYECPACRALSRLLDEYWRDSTLVYAVKYKHWPLPQHRFAELAAVSSACASEQGKFQSMHSTLFDHQNKLGLVTWKELAAMAGVTDSSEFNDCMQRPKVLAAVRSEAAIASNLQARGTPTIVFIGGGVVTGVPSKRMLDSVLQANSRLIRAAY